MVAFRDYSLVQLDGLREELQALARGCPTLRDAADACLARLHEEFSETLVLGRLFATMPFKFLPELESHCARRVAKEHRVADDLQDETSVVVLAASRGRQPEWNDPAQSHRRLAVPLVNEDCLRRIPLVGRVLSATLNDVPWLKRQGTLVLTETMGKMSSMIRVEDARTETTSRGEKAVPDQGFVEDHHIRTVLAMGGRYLNGACIVMLLFTTETLSQEQATRFTTLVNHIKTATMKQVMVGNVLDLPPD